MSSRRRDRKEQHPRPPSRRRGRPAPRFWQRISWPPIVLAVALALVAVGVVRQCEFGAPGERVVVSGVGQHVSEGQAVVYNSVPAVGGAHWPSPAAWGVSEQAVPEERAVHNLEHGGIVISHNAVAADDLTKLKALLQTYPRDKFNEAKILIRPFTGIRPGSFVVAAWGWKQTFTAYDDAAVRAFLDAHMNKCCEDVP